MDKYTVKIMNRALRDLDSIYTYIAKTLVEPETALEVVDAIEQGICSLETMPRRCPERKIGAYANKGYRQMFIRNYTVIYRIDEKAGNVIIVTVRYSPSQF